MCIDIKCQPGLPSPPSPTSRNNSEELGVVVSVYLLRRLIYMVFVLLGVSVIIFLLVRVLPGDPIRYILGPMATEDDVQHLRHELGLDQPLHVQYATFLKGIFLERKMGMSLLERRDVTDVIREKAPATIELALMAMLLAMAMGVPLGILSGIHKEGTWDKAGRIIALSGVSFPEFWIGIMLQMAFGYMLGLLPLTGRVTGAPPDHVTGMYVLDSILTGNARALQDSLKHIILPAVVLSLSPLANITRVLRARVIDETHKDYVLVNRASGMPESIVVGKYILKNAFASTLTMIGLSAGLMLGGAFVVEKVFAWPGMARYGADAVLNKDFNGIVGVTIVVCLGFVVINFVIDVLYGILDPRMRVCDHE